MRPAPPASLSPPQSSHPICHTNAHAYSQVVTGFILGKNTQDDVDSSLATAEAANGGLDSTALPIAESILDKFDWKYLDGSWTKVRVLVLSSLLWVRVSSALALIRRFATGIRPLDIIIIGGSVQPVAAPQY